MQKLITDNSKPDTNKTFYDDLIRIFCLKNVTDRIFFVMDDKQTEVNQYNHFLWSWGALLCFND